jgi:serine/threonine protein kinase
MGEVYRPRDTKLTRDVAIKVLPAALSNDADYMARFQREAQVLAALNHPNIAAIYDLECEKHANIPRRISEIYASSLKELSWKNDMKLHPCFQFTVPAEERPKRDDGARK